MNISKATLAALFLSAVPLATTVSAQVITFGTPTTFSADSDVVTPGSLLYAYRYASLDIGNSGDLAVGGVTFVAEAIHGGSNPPSSISNANVTITTPASTEVNGSSITGDPATAVAPFSSLPSNLRTLLEDSFYAFPSPAPGDSITLTLGGLISGHTYTFELGVTDPRGPVSGRTDIISDPDSSNSATLAFNTAGADGGVGQFVLGTFTANATTKNINMVGSDVFQLSFVEVRDLTVVPEPSSLALLAFGAGALLFVVHRRRHRTIQS